jgi:hypothetical protein
MPPTWLLALIVGIGLGVALRTSYRTWHRRRVASRRVVERPNSHYSSQGVLNLEARDRWHRINLRSLHPLNREEVQRLLDVVDREGTGALSPKERLFLDNMTLHRSG